LLGHIGLDADSLDKTVAPEEGTADLDADTKNLRTILIALSQKAETTSEQMDRLRQADAGTVRTLLAEILLADAQQRTNTSALVRALEGQLSFLNRCEFSLSKEAREEFEKQVRDVGPAKAGFQLLTRHATDPTQTATSGQRCATANLLKSMRSAEAGYDRSDIAFSVCPPSDEIKPSASTKSFFEDVKSKTESEGVKFAGLRRVVSKGKIDKHVKQFIREGDRQGFEEYMRQFLTGAAMPQAPETVEGVQQTYDGIRVVEATEIGEIWESLVEQAWGQYSNDAVVKTTYTLVDRMANFIGNLQGQWACPKLDEEIVAKHAKLLNVFLGYASDNKRNGHLQEALIAVTFNTEALCHGSPFRVEVNTETNATGGRDLLLFDVRTGVEEGQEIAAFESKQSTSGSIVSAFDKHTNPNTKKYYDPRKTTVLLGENLVPKMRTKYSGYRFASTLRVPYGTGGSLQLATEKAEALFTKITSLQRGEKFSMRGPMRPWADGRAVSFTFTRPLDGKTFVRTSLVDREKKLI